MNEVLLTRVESHNDIKETLLNLINTQFSETDKNE